MIYTLGVPDSEFPEVSADQILTWAKQQKEIQVDTEFSYKKGINSNPHNSTLLSLQLGDSHGINQYIIDTQRVDIKFLISVIQDPNICKVFVNAFVDLRFLLHQGFSPRNIYDCFLTEMSLTLGQDLPEGYRGLQGMAERYCGTILDKSIRTSIEELGWTKEVIEYMAGDVKYLSEIKRKQLPEVIRLDLSNEVKLNNRFSITLARVSYNGFKIDSKKWLENVKNNEKLMLEELLKLQEYTRQLEDPDFAESILAPFDTCTVNWNSPKQVTKLFKKLGMILEIRDKKTGEMKDSVGAKHLTRQKNKFEILPIYLKYKELKKEVSTYGEKFLKDNLNPSTGKVHSEFFPLLETGRISSSKPNLQNITGTNDYGEPSELRKCFIASEGNLLTIADYSQQEPRLTAEYSQDPFLIDFILNGDGDSHSLTSTAISEYLLGEQVRVSKKNNPLVPKYNQKIRDIGKMINLGLDYGKTAFSVKDDLETTQQEAQKLIDILKSKTPRKQAYFKEQAEFLKRNGYIIIDKITKRRSYFSEYQQYLELSRMQYEDRTKEQNSKYYKLRGSLERMAANYPIQGSGASMSKLAAIIFEDRCQELQLNAWIVNLVHDEIVVEHPVELKEQVQKLLEESMIKSGNIFCKTIPTKVDVFSGSDWGAKH